MTQEDKDLLLRDLCARIPYNVRMHEIDPTNNIQLEIFLSGVTCESNIAVKTKNKGIMCGAIEEFKPYLFPLSSMTEEQTKEVHSLIYQGVSESVDETKEWLKTRKENELRPITLTYLLNFKLVIDWLNENHFDYRGLIKKGLAIDATGLNIY